MTESAVRRALDESTQARLIRIYGALGRRDDAVRVYRRTRQRFAEVLGVDPGTELDAAYQDLLSRDHIPGADRTKPF